MIYFLSDDILIWSSTGGVCYFIGESVSEGVIRLDNYCFLLILVPLANTHSLEVFASVCFAIGFLLFAYLNWFYWLLKVLTWKSVISCIPPRCSVIEFVLIVGECIYVVDLCLKLAYLFSIYFYFIIMVVGPLVGPNLIVCCTGYFDG